jgi:hypothetical protein
MENILNKPEFEKVTDFNLQHQLVAYRQMLEDTIRHCLGQTNSYLVEPKYSISQFYGLLKCHKPEWPNRPIITGYNHLAKGAEDYLRPILEPLLEDCSYLVNSQKSFQARFLIEKEKFNVIEHDLVTFDIVSMYTNVNITRTISHILRVWWFLI